MGSTEIAGKLGISINTLYNWRKRLRTETHPLQQQKPVPQSPLPSFSRVILEKRNNETASSFIEINVGNSAVIRIPEHVSPDILSAPRNNFLKTPKKDFPIKVTWHSILC